MKSYRKKGITQMRPYVKGEDMTNISIGVKDSPPKEGGMIAQSNINPSDEWYISKKFFETNYEEVA